MSSESVPAVRCPTCAGRKKILGLGGMQKNCPRCAGIGFVSGVDDRVKKK